MLARPLDLGQLFNPARFLKALAQQAARGLRVPLEALALRTSFTATGAPANGCLLEGLSIEGAAIQGGVLVEVAPDAPNLAPAPPCAIEWVARGHAAADMSTSTSMLRVPLYFDYGRSAALCELEVACPASDIDNWILHAPAFFTAQH